MLDAAFGTMFHLAMKTCRSQCLRQLQKKEQSTRKFTSRRCTIGTGEAVTVPAVERTRWAHVDCVVPFQAYSILRPQLVCA